MPEFALAAPFPGLVERVGVRDNLPPHVTVLVPCPGDVAAIAEVLSAFGPFNVAFPRLERFPEILWLAPEPAEPFVAMTEAMVDRFPGYPPYGGIHDDIVPHLTVAEAELDDTAARIEPLLPLRSRTESVVLYERVEADRWRDVEAVRL
ncbi:MAG TPA: 2'-5' RNA ligase family protein [Gaiellaceae bacterium]|nr:2'-5' RNA ligase family protein [Gaiellaceae bacterium]